MTKTIGSVVWSTYIVRCKDGSLYTGMTNDLANRISVHNSGRGGGYTRSHRPVMLVYQEGFATKSEALKREAEIKSWSRQKKLSLL